MGYYTSFNGSIKITPHIPFSELKDSLWVRSNFHKDTMYDNVLEIATDDTIVDTPEGRLTSFVGTEVKLRYEDCIKAYSIVEELQALVNSFPDHKFTSYINATGEEGGDVWRLAVIDGKATQVRPQMIWPDIPE